MKENELQEHESHVNVAIPYKTRNDLKAFCAVRGLAMKETAAKAIEQYLKQEKDNGTTNK